MTDFNNKIYSELIRTRKILKEVYITEGKLPPQLEKEVERILSKDFDSMIEIYRRKNE
jgi:hypothetical protein